MFWQAHRDRFLTIVAAAALVAAAGALGCGSGSSNSPPAGTAGSGGSSSSSPDGGAHDAADGSPNGVIPTALASIEGTAEDAYDKALAGDPAAVAADATKMSSDWMSLRSQVEADGAPAATVTAVNDAIGALNAANGGSDTPVALARLANAVSAPMPTLYALYHPAVPTELLGLDYRGREIQLDGQGGDFSRAATDVSKLRATWTILKPAVTAAGGTTEASDYETSVAAVEADVNAHDGAKLATDAVAGLDLVDTMEGLFSK